MASLGVQSILAQSAALSFRTEQRGRSPSFHGRDRIRARWRAEGPAQSFGETGNAEGPSFLKPSSAWRYFVTHARGCSALLPRLGEEGEIPLP